MCKVVVTYSYDLNLNTDNLKSDNTEVPESHETNETEPDNTSLSYELEKSVLLTSDQLSTSTNDSNQDTANDATKHSREQLLLILPIMRRKKATKTHLCTERNVQSNSAILR